MDKPLKDWTLGELHEYCKTVSRCAECKIISKDHETYGCPVRYKPNIWELDNKPRFTEQDIEDARALKRLLMVEVPTAIERDKDGKIYLRSMEDLFGVGLNKDLFQSIKAGSSVPLDEIIGGKT